jgi:putative membrane protein
MAIKHFRIQLLKASKKVFVFTNNQGLIDAPTTTACVNALSGLVDVLSNLERIRDSPVPIAYSIHLRQALALYLLSLPFQLVSTMGYSTIICVLFASFTLLGIEGFHSYLF